MQVLPDLRRSHDAAAVVVPAAGAEAQTTSPPPSARQFHFDDLFTPFIAAAVMLCVASGRFWQVRRLVRAS